jgi:hypothetical protein
MLRILVGSWMVRYPLGGNLSWTLQWLVGFHRLGHDVYLVEKSGYPNSCFDPDRDAMGDDCSAGATAVDALLTRFGLAGRWCYVDAAGAYHGLSRNQAQEVIASADLFVDLGTHGAWLPDLPARCRRVVVDGEPGATQMKWERKAAAGEALPEYDFYYTNGANVGTPASDAPTAGRMWRGLFNPVVPDLFDGPAPPPAAPFTTVMNWRAHRPVTFRGREYGQKDAEFRRFLGLPRLAAVPLEVAVAGKTCPREELLAHGWAVRQGHEVTVTFDAYRDYLRSSRGEFGVCKNVFVATNSGWFSDRSAAYLGAGRPVVLQDTGFSAHLPCGRGLFAVRSPEEAAAALQEIVGDYPSHSRWARELAAGHLDARCVLRRLLGEIGFG